MTRINLVPPEELSDQHLVAEYREIFMVGSSLQRSLRSQLEKTKNSIPKKFTLNKGHVKFFYNKGKYLSERYDELIKEMKRRDMSPDPLRTFKKGRTLRTLCRVPYVLLIIGVVCNCSQISIFCF